MKKEPPPHQAQPRSRQQSRLQRKPSGGGGGGRSVAFACTAGALLTACLAPSAKAAAATAAHAPTVFPLFPLLSLASGAASASIGGGEVDPDGEGSGGVRGGEAVHAPRVPFCRAGADVANMWLPVWDPDNMMVQTAKRVVVFGGKGVDYQDKRQGEPLTYLADVWALHITNTGFGWHKVTPHGEAGPSPRWQTGHAVAYGSSLVVYGGDDETTNLVGGLGDLWVYSPRGTKSYLHADGEDYSDPNARDEWKEYAREGSLPGARREPSLTMVNSTLLLQGGKVDVGESEEECDSRFFLVDLGDPKGAWREGPSFPGECGLGQTMNTVNVTRTDDSGEEVEVPLAVVFGGCKWDANGVFACSNDLYAYDPDTDTWSEIVPESDADAFACIADDTEEEGAEVSHATHPATASEDGVQQSLSSPSTASLSSSGELGNSSSTSSSSSSSSSSGAGGEGEKGEKNTTTKKKKKKKKKAVTCPGVSTSRPLGRHAHASAYIASKEDDVNALFIFGGRENADELAPLGDLWMFDFKTMRWSEITPGSKKAPSNRFDHSLTVWQGGAGDGVASLVVFGGQTITGSGQTFFMNDVWLYTPHTGLWREVSQSDCRAGAFGIVKGGNWTAVTALVSLLFFVLVVQCFLHRICPEYEPPLRRRRRRRRKSDRPLSMSSGSLRSVNGRDSGAGGGGGGGRERPKSTSALVTQGLLASSSSSSSSGKPKPSYQAIDE